MGLAFRWAVSGGFSCCLVAGVGLAISLHAVTDELRDELVPANLQWPIEELLTACRRYPKRNGTKRITFE